MFWQLLPMSWEGKAWPWKTPQLPVPAMALGRRGQEVWRFSGAPYLSLGQAPQTCRHGAQGGIWFSRDSGVYTSLCLEAGAETVGAATERGWWGSSWTTVVKG